MKKANWLSEEALQIALREREVKGKGEKERYSHLNVELQRIVRRHKKAFLSLSLTSTQNSISLSKDYHHEYFFPQACFPTFTTIQST